MEKFKATLPKQIEPLQVSVEEAIGLLEGVRSSGSSLVRRYNAGEEFPKLEYDNWFSQFSSKVEQIFGQRSEIAGYFKNPPPSAAEGIDLMERMRRAFRDETDLLTDGTQTFVGVDRLRVEVRAVEAWLGALKRMRKAEDAEDLDAFKERAHEPNLPFEEAPKDLKRRGKI